MSRDALPDSLRIALLGDGWAPFHPGGMDRYVRELHDGLVRAGQQPRVLVTGPAGAVPSTVIVGAHRSAPLPARLVRMARGACPLLACGDVVDCHFPLYGLLPLFTLGAGRPPTVVHFHGPWAEESRAAGASVPAVAGKRAIERALYRRADRFVVLSEAFRRTLMTYGVSPDRIELVRPGVDLQRFRPLPAGRRAVIRDRLGVPRDARLVVAVRRLVPRMGLDVLLAALDGRSGSPDVVVALIGDGPSRSALEEQATALTGSVRVLFPGCVADDDLPLWYAAADLAAVPSLELEGFGLVILEALASGVPVVASDVGGIREALVGLRGAGLLPAGNIPAWREWLGGWSHGEISVPTAEHNRGHAEQFSWDATTQQVLAVYRRARAAAAERRV